MPAALCYTSSQQLPQELYQDLTYRMIGPFRASRTVGAVGIPNQPNVFFIGVNNGGVWKTDDYGRTWSPIFDSAPTGSVGDLAVSPTHPDIIYVGSGEGLHRPDLGVGDGIFKSEDGGKSWSHLGLGDIQQVARLIVHPVDPNIVFVAGLGHPYGANEMRGVFKTMDGGQSWEKVLYINHNTGASQVEFDPQNPEVVYASLWEHQEGPWENARFSGPNSGLFKSVDGGVTWNQLKNGLPDANSGLGRIGIGISPSDPNRIYATVQADEKGGVYRSDDGGNSWTLVHSNYRVWGRAGDFAELKVHPENPDVVFSGNIASYKSIDGGYHWQSIKGAPGGDDYHRIWINPIEPDIMLFAADQGATITVNGGRTWSSWYNQPTAQLYHVTTDNQFPYWVYGGQQESGAIGVASRGNGGQISFRDWMGVGVDEYAYIAPDPKDPNIIYGGRVIQFDKSTGQSRYVGPEVLRSGEVRYLRTMPLLFHPANDKMLLFGTNVLWKTLNGGQSWEQISPDLTRKQPEVPESIGDFRTSAMENMAQRAIIYALAPSPLQEDIIWAGTDDGLIHLTKDGGETWQDVTPVDLSSWDKVSQIDAGHFDEKSAYVAVNAIRKDNMNPLIYKTDDFGETWELIVANLPEIGPVNVVREDKKKEGLLFAGTERSVYFSINDGANWQPLRQNMPATSIRDLVIHDNDLVIGTHGRSIWIMDNIGLLRELNELDAETIFLANPGTGYRVRDNMFSDTPLPPEEPAGENPPDGVAVDYFLPQDVQEVMITISNHAGEEIAKFSSKDPIEQIDTTHLPHPTYWIRPGQTVSSTAGHHRFIWNLRYPSPRGAQRSFSIAAVKHRTPSGPVGPFVPPGEYQVVLQADGETRQQRLSVVLDPRVNISYEGLRFQTDLSIQCYNNYHILQDIREELDLLIENATTGKFEELLKFRGEGDPGNGDILYGSIYQSSLSDETIVGLQEKLLYMLLVFQSADVYPTDSAIQAASQLDQRVKEMVEGFETIK